MAGKIATYQGESQKGRGIIDHPNDAEGFPDYPEAEVPRDDDHDGMADDWELEHGLDPTNPDDRNSVPTAEGYTALEVYLNSLMGEHIGMTVTGIRNVATQEVAVEEQIFNVQGMRQQQLHRGLNIVRRRMADGSVKTIKLIIK